MYEKKIQLKDCSGWYGWRYTISLRDNIAFYRSIFCSISYRNIFNLIIDSIIISMLLIKIAGFHCFPFATNNWNEIDMWMREMIAWLYIDSSSNTKQHEMQTLNYTSSRINWSYMTVFDGGHSKSRQLCSYRRLGFTMVQGQMHIVLKSVQYLIYVVMDFDLQL